MSFVILSRKDYRSIFFIGSPIIVNARPRGFSCDADLSPGVETHITRTRALTANASVAIDSAGAANLTRPRTFYALLRDGNEPNVFGTFEADRPRVGLFAANGGQGGKAIFERPRTLTIAGRVARAESDTLNILLTIGTDAAGGLGNTYSARVYADGVSYAVKAYQYNENKDDLGVSLELTLVKPSDRAAIEAAAAFKFEIYDGGVWNTLFDSGKRTGIGFNFAFGAGRPNNGLSVSTNGNVDEKLRKSPESNTTIYDSARLTLRDADFKTIYDTEGNAFFQTLVPIAGLDLYTLLQYVFVTQLGFTGINTTLPNYLIRRADFNIAGTFFDGIAGHIGAFSPMLFVRNNVVWLIDSTAPFPAGFGSPAPLPASEFLSAQFAQTEIDVDGYVVTFADNETDYDYTTNRFVDDDSETSGVFGSASYTETTRSRTYRDYFKLSNPFVPVRSEKTKDVKTTKGMVDGTLVTLATETENLNFDTFGRILQIQKDIFGLVPDLAAPGFPASNRTIRSEKSQFLYGPDKLDPVRQILKQTIKEVSGLVTVDTDNEHLGKPFKQELVDGLAAGNLSETLIVESISIQTTTETIDQNDKGQNEIRTRTVNFLTDPPQIIQTSTDARGGDMSSNASTGGTNEVVVFRTGATRSNAKFATLSVGELPVQFATALARRKLALRRKRTGTVTLKGLKLSIGRGTMFEIFDADGISAGKFVCEGFAVAGANLGTNAQTTRQTLEVTQI